MAKVLIIEDELFLYELYDKVLKEAGYEVAVAVDGEQGLKLALEKPDVILLDVMIPKMNGIDVLRILRNRVETKNTPIVLLTNLADEKIIKTAFDIGINDCILKAQINPFELKDYVDKYVKNPQSKKTFEDIKL